MSSFSFAFHQFYFALFNAALSSSNVNWRGEGRNEGTREGGNERREERRKERRKEQMKKGGKEGKEEGTKERKMGGRSGTVNRRKANLFRKYVYYTLHSAQNTTTAAGHLNITQRSFIEIWN